MFLLRFSLLCVSTIVCLVTNVDQSRDVGHVVIISSPFFGHIIPMLDFAKRLSEYHYVTYVVSASKLDTLKRRGFISKNINNNNVNYRSRLEFIGLFDCNDDDFEVS